MAHLNLEEVLGRTVDLLEGLCAGLWNRLHDAGEGEKNEADASLRTTRSGDFAISDDEAGPSLIRVISRNSPHFLIIFLHLLERIPDN